MEPLGDSNLKSLTLDETYEERRQVHILGRIDNNSTLEAEDQDEALVESSETIHNRRTALWSRARGLSVDSIRPTMIIDLPLEILREIFDYLQKKYMPVERKEKWSYEASRLPRIAKCRSALPNVRLTCRLFHGVASPLLFSVLRIPLDQNSLDLAHEISERPHLANGVSKIIVDLAYRPKELANDFDRFQQRREEDVHDVLGSIYFPLEFGAMEEKAFFHGTMNNYHAILSAWDSYVEHPHDDMSDERGDYRQILVRGHEEYRKKHDEQQRLINGGSFVNSLATAITRMPHLRTVELADPMERYHDPYDPTLMLNNKEYMAKYMSFPHCWNEIEHMEVELLAVRILSDLPVALHEVGMPLSHLAISCFPTEFNCHMLCSSHQAGQTAVWDQFRVSCQDLSSFQLQINHKPIRHEPIAPGQRTYIDRFLTAILSSQKLTDVSLLLDGLGTNSGDNSDDDSDDDSADHSREHYIFGPVLGTINWPRIRKLTIGCVSLTQEDLETFCDGLGRGTLEQLRMYSIQLTTGVWRGTLDILRDKLSQRHRSVSFSDFVGGELSEEVRVRDLSVKLAARYVAGDSEVRENPL